MEKIKQQLIRIWETIVRFWKKKHITQILLLTTLVIILLTILYFAFLASRVNVQQLKDGLSQATLVYDKDGNEATAVGTNRTKGMKMAELPEHVPNAVIAIEDERFYNHNGFDLKGIFRSFLNNLLAGRITGGGSTITQQLTKNALLSPERTYKRKAEELFLAVEVEKAYKKDEILEMYLHQVYFGGGAWGIDRAAIKYFNKDIKDVTISEAALLAGLLKAPSSLNPYNNFEGAIQRRDLVLGNMNKLGMITGEEYEKAKNEQINLEDGGGSLVKRQYKYYVDAVLDEATSKYALTQEEILTKGYQIYTELDPAIQTSLEEVYERDSLFPRNKGGTLVQSGAVLLDPKNGGVRGLVGGRGEHVFRGFNRATHIKAQPGSTMKPLAVYAPALEDGYHITSELVDEKMSFGNYEPENFTKQYQGEVPMYKAVEDSINIPAVWLLDQIGLEKGISSVRKFGIPVSKEDENLALALGGMHNGVSPLQMAEAYSVFPNEGKRRDSHFITKIVGPTGETIAEHKPKTTSVIYSSTAREMTSLLLNVVETGTGQATNIDGVQIAGKTGSTQLPYADIQGTKDQWFVGYTPNIVGAIWLGFDTTDREHYLPSSSSQTVVPIFREIMEGTLQHIEPGEFDVKSVNERLKENRRPDKILKEKAEELEEKLKEESSKWKERLKNGFEELEGIGKKLKDELNNIQN